LPGSSVTERVVAVPQENFNDFIAHGGTAESGATFQIPPPQTNAPHASRKIP
jgi:hypothetical protein